MIPKLNRMAYYCSLKYDKCYIYMQRIGYVILLTQRHFQNPNSYIRNIPKIYYHKCRNCYYECNTAIEYDIT